MRRKSHRVSLKNIKLARPLRNRVFVENLISNQRDLKKANPLQTKVCSEKQQVGCTIDAIKNKNGSLKSILQYLGDIRLVDAVTGIMFLFLICCLCGLALNNFHLSAALLESEKLVDQEVAFNQRIIKELGSREALQSSVSEVTPVVFYTSVFIVLGFIGYSLLVY
jgi:hypothetical protein